MSLRIIRGGVLDTIQDLGRYGFQFQGINPGGAMDVVAAQLANIIAGNTSDEAVIEMHFPASTCLFEEDALIALSGGDFGACINDQPVPVHTPLLIKKYSTLHFKKLIDGARCYLAVHGGLKIPAWLNSYSTNLKAVAGGMEGRCLRINDKIVFQRNEDYSALLQHNNYRVLPWKADHTLFYSTKNCIRICEGISYQHLTSSSKLHLANGTFSITHQSDRMGYRMKSEPLQLHHHEELISSAVVTGTIQLLPDGQLIILMADHQTTGGYPRIAQVISADLPTLAQLNSNQQVQFEMTDHATAEELLLKQHHSLQKIQTACAVRWASLFQ